MDEEPGSGENGKMYSWRVDGYHGFGDSYSGVGAIDAAQGKMGIDAKREKKKDILT